MGTQRFIGIDLSKRTYEAVALSGDEAPVRRWNGKMDLQGRTRLLDRLQEGDIVGLEAGTG